jgi:hypothetical protein
VLEQPPTEQDGGGFNATLSCCSTGSGNPGELTVTLAQPLMPGQRIAVQWLLGLKQKGNFQFYVNIEGLTETPN